ncbi:MAG TPA: TPM domain-containing protein [Bacteroidia bacterium]|nr:TPM domain-containing protein [Bacteroidia bacterium]
MILKKDNSAKNFFSAKEKRVISHVIAEAELNTSGEIRLHIENNCAGDVFAQATKVFYILKMNDTKHKNAVLFYLAVKDKKFAIVADKGINDMVPVNFWDTIKNNMQAHFAEKKFHAGICQAIEITGIKLQEFFPYEDGDTNELSNEISIG